MIFQESYIIPEDLLLFLPIKPDMTQSPPFDELSVSPSQLLALLFLSSSVELFLFPSISPISNENTHIITKKTDQEYVSNKNNQLFVV